MAVTPNMIAVALGQAAPESGSVTEAQWQMWIEDALMLIEDRRVSLGIVEPIGEAKLDYVVRESVVSHIRKPDDATQVTISVDDASSSRTYQSGKGRVTILDEWWALLGLVEQNEGAFSVDMVGGLALAHLPWCSLVLGSAHCSCGVSIAGVPIYETGGNP